MSNSAECGRIVSVAAWISLPGCRERSRRSHPDARGGGRPAGLPLCRKREDLSGKTGTVGSLRDVVRGDGLAGQARDWRQHGRRWVAPVGVFAIVANFTLNRPAFPVGVAAWPAIAP